MSAIAPNRRQFVQDCIAKYPEAWNKCLAPHDDGTFIRLVARDLNAVDPRFGLNAKRDGPAHDISKDCLAYYRGPSDRHVEVYDVIGAHEAPNANITWQDQTNYSTIGNPGTARFVHPVTNGGYDGPPIGGNPNPNPGVPMYTLGQAVSYLVAVKGSPLTADEINHALVRAQQLGYTGGNEVAQSIVHQIAIEMFLAAPVAELKATLTEAFKEYPAGTKVTIKLG